MSYGLPTLFDINSAALKIHKMPVGKHAVNSGNDEHPSSHGIHEASKLVHKLRRAKKVSYSVLVNSTEHKSSNKSQISSKEQ